MKDQSSTIAGLVKKNSLLKKQVEETNRLKPGNKIVYETVRKSGEYFKAIIQNSSDVIIVLDKPANIRYASPSVEHFLGYKPDELTGTATLDLIVPDDRQRAISDFRKALTVKKRLIHNEFRMRHKNGTERIFEGVGNNLLDNPIVAGFVMNIRDITDRKQAEEELRKSEERYRVLVENASDFVYIMDLNGNVTFVNPSGFKALGYDKKEIIGKNYSVFIRPDMRGEAITFFGRQLAQNTNNTYSEYPILTKSGYEIWLGQNTQLIIKDGKAIGFQAVSRDITEKKRREEALRSSENKYRKLSIIDDLTRLYNSRYFYVQLKKEIERSNRYGQPLALLLLDIDNFKQFNDTYGHVEGDQVLLRFGQIAKRCLRQTDSAYRYGGEEFTIILPMTTGKNATFTAERIRADFKRESFYQESTPDNHLTVSIGLAQYKTNENMIAFVNRVDQLMYQAKQQGKDRICHEEQWQNGSDN